MTNKELILKAMPLYNLTNDQWDSVQKLIETTSDKLLLSALETITSNQSKIETLCMIFDSNPDINNTVRQERVQLATIGE